MTRWAAFSTRPAIRKIRCDRNTGFFAQIRSLGRASRHAKPRCTTFTCRTDPTAAAAVLRIAFEIPARAFAQRLVSCTDAGSLLADRLFRAGLSTRPAVCGFCKQIHARHTAGRQAIGATADPFQTALAHKAGGVPLAARLWRWGGASKEAQETSKKAKRESEVTHRRSRSVARSAGKLFSSGEAVAMSSLLWARSLQALAEYFRRCVWRKRVWSRLKSTLFQGREVLSSLRSTQASLPR